MKTQRGGPGIRQAAAPRLRFMAPSRSATQHDLSSPNDGKPLSARGAALPKVDAGQREAVRRIARPSRPALGLSLGSCAIDCPSLQLRAMWSRVPR